MSVGGGAVAGSTRKEIQNLLQNILVATSTLDNLPPNCSTSVKLQYYDKGLFCIVRNTVASGETLIVLKSVLIFQSLRWIINLLDSSHLMETQ